MENMDLVLELVNFICNNSDKKTALKETEDRLVTLLDSGEISQDEYEVIWDKIAEILIEIYAHGMTQYGYEIRNHVFALSTTKTDEIIQMIKKTRRR